MCLYGANVVDPEQLRASARDLRIRCPTVLIAVDEEGGDVTRLHYPTGSPSRGNAVLGRLDDARLTRARRRRRSARSSRAVGINLDLAPVVDVNSAADNPVIGVRSFGADAALVARHSAAWVRGPAVGGVAACAKHFPGHGDTVDRLAPRAARSSTCRPTCSRARARAVRAPRSTPASRAS